ncbi:hypothetical protein [Vibrio sp. 10N.247.311.51]|uniref:hypothetical protein n=1 Tax=Vibrio sp. 10N.247.311.51 TaxID=3229996 RepID=UPI00354F37EE
MTDSIIIVFAGLAILVTLIFMASSQKDKEDAENSKLAEKAMQSLIVDQLEVIEQGVSECEVQGIRKKKNEIFLGASTFIMYKYKRNGSYKYHGLRYRVKIAKGLSYSIGQGQVKASSSWQSEGVGTLIISNQAITYYNGVNAKRMTWGSILSIDVALDGVTIAPSRGAALRFASSNIQDPEVNVIALAVIESQSQGSLDNLTALKINSERE